MSIRTRNSTYYFPTYQAALDYALTNAWPTDRIISYGLGYAIQLYCSGPYVGPQSEGARRHNALMATRYGAMRAF